MIGLLACVKMKFFRSPDARRLSGSLGSILGFDLTGHQNAHDASMIGRLSDLHHVKRKVEPVKHESSVHLHTI